MVRQFSVRLQDGAGAVEGNKEPKTASLWAESVR